MIKKKPSNSLQTQKTKIHKIELNKLGFGFFCSLFVDIIIIHSHLLTQFMRTILLSNYKIKIPKIREYFVQKSRNFTILHNIIFFQLKNKKDQVRKKKTPNIIQMCVFLQQ